jgi:hypothetical protein
LDLIIDDDGNVSNYDINKILKTTKYVDLQLESKKVWDYVKKLREEGKLPPEPTEEELEDEPTALAFTPYVIEETSEPQKTPKRLTYKKKNE